MHDRQTQFFPTGTGCRTGDMAEPLRVAQLSDTHFIEVGGEPEGLGAYDTALAFERVFADMDQDIDHLVVTGDVADHGRAEQYDVAAKAFGRFDVDVMVCAGNHDFEVPFRDRLVGSNIAIPPVVEREGWAFLFVDSASGEMIPGAGGPEDPPHPQRLHSNGSLSASEVDRIRTAARDTEADHLFVWLHHPPAPDENYMANAAYNAQWRELLADIPTIRGLGAGHLHLPVDWDFSGRPVFVGPSLKNNFSLEDDTWLPPGYRTYAFHADGTVESQLHLVDDESLWPRQPLGRALRSLFSGELTFDELYEIVARREARDS